MAKSWLMITFFSMALFTIGLVGCQTSTSPATTPAANEGADNGDSAQRAEHSAQAAGEGTTDMDKMRQELAKLPEADRAAAEKQHMCPVTGNMLGTMGPPLKVQVKDRDVWLCCPGCKEELLANPDKYLAKLSQ